MEESIISGRATAFVDGCAVISDRWKLLQWSIATPCGREGDVVESVPVARK